MLVKEESRKLGFTANETETIGETFRYTDPGCLWLRNPCIQMGKYRRYSPDERIQQIHRCKWSSFFFFPPMWLFWDQRKSVQRGETGVYIIISSVVTTLFFYFFCCKELRAKCVQGLWENSRQEASCEPPGFSVWLMILIRSYQAQTQELRFCATWGGTVAQW